MPMVRPLSLCGLLLLASAASAQTFLTSITPEQVVPATPSTASGDGSLALDPGSRLAFEITITGLHGAETEASIHGPALVGANAGAVFQLPLGNHKTGSVGPLTPAQVTDLQAGLWYVVIHTTHHRSGEIRGQIRPVLAVEPSTWGKVKEVYGGR